MTKAETIRFLASEWVIKIRLAKPRPLAEERIPSAFRGWRGWPISDKVVSL